MLNTCIFCFKLKLNLRVGVGVADEDTWTKKWLESGLKIGKIKLKSALRLEMRVDFVLK